MIASFQVARSWDRAQAAGRIRAGQFRRLQTLSVAVVNGDDLTGVYLRAGLVF